jgi:hypothetical protein
MKRKSVTPDGSGNIEELIHTVRGQIILDADLARLYGVETRTLNQAIKRNRKRFPDDFMFQLSFEESRERSALQDHNL